MRKSVGLFLLACSAASIIVNTVALSNKEEYIEDTGRFPGWRGSLPQSAPSVIDPIPRLLGGVVTVEQDVWNGRIEQVSWKPRAYLLHNFLSDEECDYIISLASSQLTKSAVVDSDTGNSFDSEVRTSKGTFLQRDRDEIVSRIERRIAAVTGIPVEHGEALQVLRYVDGQKYEAHTDYFYDAKNRDDLHGGQRAVTLLSYLSTPEEGGETCFPYAESKVSGPGWSDCARQGLSVKAVKGNAVLFHDLYPDGTEDPHSTHIACPVIKGVKWSAPKWIHLKPYEAPGNTAKAGCLDEDSRCEDWSLQGECTANPGFMLVSCRKSCNACGSNGVVKKMSRKEVGLLS